MPPELGHDAALLERQLVSELRGIAMLSARRAVPLAPVIATAAVFAAAGEVRAAAGSTNLEMLGTVLGEVSARVHEWVVHGYALRPAVMIGLGTALVLPFLVIAGVLLHRQQTGQAAPSTSFDFGPTAVAARIAVDGRSAVELPPGRDFVQIGRLADNDVCIEDDSVQQYHAVIERLPPIGFAITDVSGLQADGVRINGEPCLTAVLAHGDLVEIGQTKMRFEIQH